jgi:hypothetical protein
MHGPAPPPPLFPYRANAGPSPHTAGRAATDEERERPPHRSWKGFSVTVFEKSERRVRPGVQAPVKRYPDPLTGERTGPDGSSRLPHAAPPAPGRRR